MIDLFKMQCYRARSFPEWSGLGEVEARSFILFCVGVGAHTLGTSAFPGVLAGKGSEVEHLRYKLVVVWEDDIAGGILTHNYHNTSSKNCFKKGKICFLVLHVHRMFLGETQKCIMRGCF